VVPDTPAPIVPPTISPVPTAAKPPSLWTRFIAWLTGSSERPVAAKAPAASTPVATRARPERDHRGRGERKDRRESRGEKTGGERAGQARGDRAERSDRGRDQAPRRDKPAVTARPETVTEDRGRRRGRGGDAGARQGRDGRAPTDGRREAGAESRAPATLPAVEVAASAPATMPATLPAGDTGGGGDERRGRRRRRRGRGSERGDRAAGGAPAGAQVDEDAEVAVLETVDREPSVNRQDSANRESSVREPSFNREASANREPSVREPSFNREASANRESSVSREPLVRSAVETEAPVAETAAKALVAPSRPSEARPARAIDRAIEPAPMPVAELLPIVESSGMTLAQTDPLKLAAAQARAAESQPAPMRMGRERPVLTPIEETPLQQVETRGQP
jgi:ribonuclease E